VSDPFDGPKLTPTQRKVWVLSALGVALDGFDFFIIGVALPLIDRDFAPGPWQTGAVGAAAVLYLFDLLFFLACTFMNLGPNTTTSVLSATLAVVAGASLLGLVTTWAFRVETAGRSLGEFE
jgi:hypothetical protein